jgi:hypothetical protein
MMPARKARSQSTMTPGIFRIVSQSLKKSDNLRRGIVERAELSKDFDILAAWEEVQKLDESIAERIPAARKNQ